MALSDHMFTVHQGGYWDKNVSIVNTFRRLEVGRRGCWALTLALFGWNRDGGLWALTGLFWFRVIHGP